MKVKKLYEQRPECYFDKEFWLIGLKDTLGSRGIETAEVVKMMPNAETHYHNHPDMEETYYIFNGEGELTVNGRKKKVKAGDALYFPPVAYHSMRNTGTCALYYIAFSARVT